MPEGKEYFTPADIEEIIQFNRRLMQSQNQHHGVNRGMLEYILLGSLDRYRDIKEKRKRIIEMATHILFNMAQGDSRGRLFFNGNKRTATTTTIKFLNWNGYDLAIELLDVSEEIHGLLTDVQHYRCSFNDVGAFLNRRITVFIS